LSPIVVKAVRVKKRRLVLLVALVFLAFFMSRTKHDLAEQKTVEVMAASLTNRVIVVDPGHGGIDPGVVGRSGAMEKDVTLEVGRRLAASLGQAGAMVLMTRDTDTDLSDPGTIGASAKKREDLKRRVALANDNEADLYVSIHVNSTSDPSRRGAQTFVQQGSAESKKASQMIQSELAGLLKNTARQPSEVDFYITRNTSMPAVIVEIGFMTNETEEKLLADPVYQGKVAWAVYAGMVKYFAQGGVPALGASEKDKVIKTFKEQAPGSISEP
jgi:N-acetylmuramoyl-L-alanine amidase